jgi:hypothetical protein
MTLAKDNLEYQKLKQNKPCFDDEFPTCSKVCVGKILSDRFPIQNGLK